MKHIVLLGDSIFDNGAYVDRGPDVIKHLHSLLPGDWQATLLAVDGSVTTDVIRQISKIPASATHLIVSARIFSNGRRVSWATQWTNWPHSALNFIRTTAGC